MAVINPFQNNQLQTGALERGLAGLGDIAARQQVVNEREAAKEVQALKQQELLNVLESDDLMAQRSFLAANPEYAQQFAQAMDFANEATKQNLVDSSIRILQGEDPYEVIRDRAAFVSRAGGSPVDTLAALEDSPEEIMRAARFNVSAYGTPQQAEAIKDLTATPDIKVGRFQYKETPAGFLKVDTATGQESEVKVGSKEAETARKANKARLDADIKAEKDVFEQSKKLRDEYNKASSDFVKVEDAFDRVQASAEDPDAAGDIALIFNYMKMLDPGSVVREGEFATAQNAGSVEESVYNMYNRLMSGERLNPNQRKMFLGRAEKLFKTAKNTNSKRRSDILSVGKRYNISERDIFGEPSEVVVEAQAQEATQAQPSYQEGQTATNPTTGQRMVFRGGQWQQL